MNRSQAGIRSRRRRPGRLHARATVGPLHESSSVAQSAKTGSDPTAAHGLPAARLLIDLVFQFSQKASTARPRLLSISVTPTYHQRTAPGGGRWRWIGGLLWWWMDHRFFLVMNRRRSRASVNRSQAGIRSRRRRRGALVTPRASDLPLHESSSDAQSAKTESDSTAAHGLSAARLPKELVFQFSRKPSTTRPRHLSISFTPPTYPQRTAPVGHSRCFHHLRPQPPFRSGCARPPQSLSLGSFGDSEHLP